jgi:hypothetical protein
MVLNPVTHHVLSLPRTTQNVLICPANIYLHAVVDPRGRMLTPPKLGKIYIKNQ